MLLIHMNLYEVTASNRENNSTVKVYVISKDRSKAEQSALSAVAQRYKWNIDHMFAYRIDLLASAIPYEQGSSNNILIVPSE
jgi:hypothetical protein